MKATRIFIVLACVLGLTAFSGCLGRNDEGQVRSVVNNYIAARDAGDAAKVCALYTEEFRVQRGLAHDCPAKLTAQFKAEPKGTTTTIASVKVHDGQARVDLDLSAGGAAPSRLTLGLIDKDGHWRIAASN